MDLTNINEWYRLGQAYLGTDDYGANLYIRVYARYTAQDETNLTSTVQYQARAYFDRSWWILDQGSNGSLSGTDATTETFSKSSRYESGETTLKTITATVNHNQDTGAASITASATLNFPNWNWSGTASGSGNLPTIDVSTIRLRVSGTWKKAIPYLRVNGSWKKCKAYLRVSGNWKKGV